MSVQQPWTSPEWDTSGWNAQFQQWGIQAEEQFKAQMNAWMSPEAQQVLYEQGLTKLTDYAFEKIPGLTAEVERKGEEILTEKYQKYTWWLIGGGVAALMIAYGAGRRK